MTLRGAGGISGCVLYVWYVGVQLYPALFDLTAHPDPYWRVWRRS